LGTHRYPMTRWTVVVARNVTFLSYLCSPHLVSRMDRVYRCGSNILCGV